MVRAQSEPQMDRLRRGLRVFGQIDIKRLHRGFSRIPDRFDACSPVVDDSCLCSNSVRIGYPTIPVPCGPVRILLAAAGDEQRRSLPVVGLGNMSIPPYRLP